MGIFIYTIKRTTSKSQNSYGATRLTMEVGYGKKIEEIGLGYDLVGALLLKFIKTRYDNKQVKELFKDFNPMSGTGEVLKKAHSIGLKVELVHENVSGKVVGFMAND